MPHGADKGTAFKSILVAAGDPDSNPDFYLPGGGATEADFQNLIDVVFERTTPGSTERRDAIIGLSEVGFFDPGDSLSFWIDATPEDVAGEQAGLASAVDRLTSTSIGGGEESSVAGTFIGGGQIVKIERAGQEPLWGMSFTASGGIEHIYTFGSEEELNAALGKNAAVAHGFNTIDEESLNDGNRWLMGDAAMFAGQEGNYGAFWDDLVIEQDLRSGIRDPGRLGDYVNDPEVAKLMAEATQAGWSEVQLQAELRRTKYYQTVLYPGIKNILDRGDTLDPEGTYKQYVRDVESSLRLLGYEPDENGSFGEHIGRMLDQKIEADDFTTIAPLFNRAQDNPELFTALDFWLDQVAGRDVDFNDLFDAIAGLDTGELSEAIEKATIQFHANKQSTILTPEQITRLANLSNLSEQGISIAFTSVEEDLLALGAKGLKTSGLTEQALVDAAFEIGDDNTFTETRRLARKAILERGLSDDRKAQFFQSFDSTTGRPFRPGLTAGTPERG